MEIHTTPPPCPEPRVTRFALPVGTREAIAALGPGEWFHMVTPPGVSHMTVQKRLSAYAYSLFHGSRKFKVKRMPDGNYILRLQ
jgi:hypothetical protein